MCRHLYYNSHILVPYVDFHLIRCFLCNPDQSRNCVFHSNNVENTTYFIFFTHPPGVTFPCLLYVHYDYIYSEITAPHGGGCKQDKEKIEPETICNLFYHFTISNEEKF